METDALGRAASFVRKAGDGRPVVDPDSARRFSATPLTTGGTYLITDPQIPARRLQILANESDPGSAILNVDGHGGGVRCHEGICQLAFAIADGAAVVRRTIKGSDLGYEAILDPHSPGGVMAVRIGP